MAEGSAREVKCVMAGWWEPSGLVQAGWGQWQKPLEYFFFAVEEVEVHYGSAVGDVHFGKGAAPSFDRFFEGEVWVHFSGDVSGHEKGRVPGEEGSLSSLVVGKFVPGRFHDGSGALLQSVQDVE